jgi:carboxyl-terminal processing protease
VKKTITSLATVLDTVEKNYADPVSTEKAIYNGAIPGMLNMLDPHSNFFDPKAFQAMREDQRGRYYGVGMQVASRSGRTVVMAPFPGSPAAKAGLRPGDIIWNVDGNDTEGLNTTEVANLLKGPRGTTVQVKAKREGEAELLSFTIVRDEIPRFSVEHAFMIEPGVAYMRITSFMETTSAELREHLKDLTAQGMTGLVLDLRGNPGGLLKEGVSVSEMFLNRGQVIVSHKGRNSREQQYSASRLARSSDIPLVILIDRSSASAAEIVSGAMQDHDRGLIVGEPSFGKGLVQTVFPLSENTGLALTTAKYYTPSGRLIQRDYSSLSLYDYYNDTNKAAGTVSQTDVRRTDTGRTVYGGGGITPDVQFAPPKANDFQLLMARRDTFFQFASRYLAENKSITRDFEATPQVVDRFRKFLGELKLDYDSRDFDANLEYVQQRIRIQLVLVQFGMNDAYRVEAVYDPSIKKAIEMLPLAGSMLETTRRAQLEKEKK